MSKEPPQGKNINLLMIQNSQFMVLIIADHLEGMMSQGYFSYFTLYKQKSHVYAED